MDGENFFVADYLPTDADLPAIVDRRFIAERYRVVHDAADRRARISVLAGEAISKLLEVHRQPYAGRQRTLANVAELARLVLDPDERRAGAYVLELRRTGLSVDQLFENLLEPAARRLGALWDEDELDFVDVTLGVARLQALLSIFNGTHALAAVEVDRSVLMLTVPGEQHSFGAAMVEQLLEAGGWRVKSEREMSLGALAQLVRDEWFAVVGIALSSRRNLDAVSNAIATIRAESCNKSIGVMVGGSAFATDAGLSSELGADATASSGPLAVVLAQKLFDDAIAGGSRGTLAVTS